MVLRGSVLMAIVEGDYGLEIVWVVPILTLAGAPHDIISIAFRRASVIFMLHLFVCIICIAQGAVCHQWHISCQKCPSLSLPLSIHHFKPSGRFERNEWNLINGHISWEWLLVLCLLKHTQDRHFSKNVFFFFVCAVRSSCYKEIRSALKSKNALIFVLVITWYAPHMWILQLFLPANNANLSKIPWQDR